VTGKTDVDGTNCPYTPYGLCSDGTPMSDASGTNCTTQYNQYNPTQPSYSPTTNTVFIAPPMGLGSSTSTSDSSKTSDSSNTSSSTTDSPSTCTPGTCPEPQPCPPCGRCPEPSFECKKVPNYASTNSEYLPMPVLSDFSTFGM